MEKTPRSPLAEDVISGNSGKIDNTAERLIASVFDSQEEIVDPNQEVHICPGESCSMGWEDEIIS